MDSTVTDIYQLIEEAPKYAEATADLYSWSLNFDPGQGPMTLFIDLIGWSEDNIGETLYNLTDASLGYLELSKLAGALEEYSVRPTDVREFVDQLMLAESAE